MKPTRYIIALLLMVSICIALCLSTGQSASKKVSTLLMENDSLKRQIEALSLKINNSTKQIDTLTHQIKTLQQDQRKLRERTDFLNRGGERPIKRNMNVSAYWKGSCGKNLGDPTYGITASGKTVQVGMIAAGPELDTGTKIYIPYFNRVFTVEDRGGAITNGHLDIYMETAAECFEFGRVPEMEVYILCN